MKNKYLILTILGITIITYTLLAFLPITVGKTYAKDMAVGTLSRDVDAIDDSLYPGYKTLIKQMQAKHPNYVFLLYYTGLDWNHVLTAEYQGHGTSPKNLFQISEKYNGMWLCPLCGNKSFDNGSWCCASLESLAYMMDPRNSINDSDIFQFKDLEEAGISYGDVAKAVSKYGAYINNGEVIQAIIDASNEYKINPYFLVAKIINEHGKDGSVLSNGQGYNGKFIGIYNYFNIGASGNGKDNIINSGFTYAQNSGWNSRRASILGGAAIVRNSYINEHSQNTFYYQKFNVSGRDTIGAHQYQQNIMAAQSQGTSMKAYYDGSSYSGLYTFIIPLYKNMPKSASVRPDCNKSNSIQFEEGIIQNVSKSLTIRAGQSINSLAIGKLNNNEPVKILRRATSQVDGYYWDLILNTTGTYGYAARYINGDQCIVGKGSTGTSTGSVVETTPTPSLSNSTQPNINKDIQYRNNNIEISPNITVEYLKQKYKDVAVKTKDGVEVKTGVIGTEYKATTGGNTYNIVKKGDVNGDGAVTIIDAVTMLNAVSGKKELYGVYKVAASIKNGDSFNITDVVMLLNYIRDGSTGN